MPRITNNKNPPSELTYLALEETLIDKRSKEISRKDLLLIVRDHEDEVVKALVRKYGHKNVAVGARDLLQQDVFKHRAIAENKLSRILYFTDSESESEEGRANGSAGGKAARDRPQPRQPRTLQERVAASSENYVQNQWRDEPLLQQLAGVRRKKEWKGQPIPDYDSKDPLSPHPVMLPFRIQHRLLSNFIQMLEESCYDYAVIHAPEIVAHRRYDCSEESELQKWTTDFSEKKTFQCDNEKVAAHRETLLNKVAKMRHNVVHRERVGVDTIAQYFCSASELATLMGDTETRSIIYGLWQAIEMAAFGLMEDTLAKFKEHTKTMDSIRVQKDALNARKQDGLTSSQVAALAAERETVLAAENQIIGQAQRDYRELSQAAGREVEQAISERGIKLGTLGVWMPPEAVTTIAEGPREGEMASIEAAVAKFASMLPQDEEENVEGSYKEAEGADEGETSDQPSKSPADVQGKRKEEEPHEKKMQVHKQKQDVHEGGKKQDVHEGGKRQDVYEGGKRQDVHEGGVRIRAQGESSASKKIRLLSKEEWRSLSAERNTGYEAGQGAALVASFSRKKEQVVPEEGPNLYSASGSQNGRGSSSTNNGRGSRNTNNGRGSRTKRRGPRLEGEVNPWFRSGN